jgi:hypothetical protein
LFPIPKSSAARQNEIHYFGCNSKGFFCAAERNTVNSSCSCWQIPQIFTALQNKINLIPVAFVGKFQNFGWAGEQIKYS